MVLMSETTWQVVLLELTVPWEDQMEETYERERAKFEELVGEFRSMDGGRNASLLRWAAEALLASLSRGSSSSLVSHGCTVKKSHQKHH